MSDILVVYATRYGSTREVAEHIASTLRESGHTVDLKPAREVRSLNKYDGVVFGAPLYIGSWPKDARRFLDRHRDVLRTRRTAIFTLGPTELKEEDWKSIRDQLQKQLDRYPWLEPVAVELFGGRIDPSALRFPDSLLTSFPGSPLRNMPASDIRDWEAIRSWATMVSAKL